MHVRVLLIFGDNVIGRVCKYIHHIFISAQIIATSHAPNGRVVGEHPNKWPSGKSRLVKYYFNIISFGQIYVYSIYDLCNIWFWWFTKRIRILKVDSMGFFTANHQSKKADAAPRVAPYDRKSIIHVMKIWKLILLCMGLFVNMDATHIHIHLYICTFSCVYIISYTVFIFVLLMLRVMLSHQEPMELTNTCASWRKQRASKENLLPKVTEMRWSGVALFIQICAVYL